MITRINPNNNVALKRKKQNTSKPNNNINFGAKINTTVLPRISESFLNTDEMTLANKIGNFIKNIPNLKEVKNDKALESIEFLKKLQSDVEKNQHFDIRENVMSITGIEHRSTVYQHVGKHIGNIAEEDNLRKPFVEMMKDFIRGEELFPKEKITTAEKITTKITDEAPQKAPPKSFDIPIKTPGEDIPQPTQKTISSKAKIQQEPEPQEVERIVDRTKVNDKALQNVTESFLCKDYSVMKEKLNLFIKNIPSSEEIKSNKAQESIKFFKRLNSTFDKIINPEVEEIIKVSENITEKDYAKFKREQEPQRAFIKEVLGSHIKNIAVEEKLNPHFDKLMDDMKNIKQLFEVTEKKSAKEIEKTDTAKLVDRSKVKDTELSKASESFLNHDVTKIKEKLDTFIDNKHIFDEISDKKTLESIGFLRKLHSALEKPISDDIEEVIKKSEGFNEKNFEKLKNAKEPQRDFIREHVTKHLKNIATDKTLAPKFDELIDGIITGKPEQLFASLDESDPKTANAIFEATGKSANKIRKHFNVDDFGFQKFKVVEVDPPKKTSIAKERSKKHLITEQRAKELIKQNDTQINGLEVPETLKAIHFLKDLHSAITEKPFSNLTKIVKEATQTSADDIEAAKYMAKSNEVLTEDEAVHKIIKQNIEQIADDEEVPKSVKKLLGGIEKSASKHDMSELKKQLDTFKDEVTPYEGLQTELTELRSLRRQKKRALVKALKRKQNTGKSTVNLQNSRGNKKEALKELQTKINSLESKNYTKSIEEHKATKPTLENAKADCKEKALEEKETLLNLTIKQNDNDLKSHATKKPTLKAIQETAHKKLLKDNEAAINNMSANKAKKFRRELKKDYNENQLNKEFEQKMSSWQTQLQEKTQKLKSSQQELNDFKSKPEVKKQVIEDYTNKHLESTFERKTQAWQEKLDGMKKAQKEVETLPMLKKERDSLKQNIIKMENESPELAPILIEEKTQKIKSLGQKIQYLDGKNFDKMIEDHKNTKPTLENSKNLENYKKVLTKWDTALQRLEKNKTDQAKIPQMREEMKSHRRKISELKNPVKRFAPLIEQKTTQIDALKAQIRPTEKAVRDLAEKYDVEFTAPINRLNKGIRDLTQEHRKELIHTDWDEVSLEEEVVDLAKTYSNKEINDALLNKEITDLVQDYKVNSNTETKPLEKGIKNLVENYSKEAKHQELNDSTIREIFAQSIHNHRNKQPNPNRFKISGNYEKAEQKWKQELQDIKDIREQAKKITPIRAEILRESQELARLKKVTPDFEFITKKQKQVQLLLDQKELKEQIDKSNKVVSIKPTIIQEENKLNNLVSKFNYQQTVQDLKHNFNTERSIKNLKRKKRVVVSLINKKAKLENQLTPLPNNVDKKMLNKIEGKINSSQTPYEDSVTQVINKIQQNAKDKVKMESFKLESRKSSANNSLKHLQQKIKVLENSSYQAEIAEHLNQKPTIESVEKELESKKDALAQRALNQHKIAVSNHKLKKPTLRRIKADHKANALKKHKTKIEEYGRNHKSQETKKYVNSLIAPDMKYFEENSQKILEEKTAAWEMKRQKLATTEKNPAKIIEDYTQHYFENVLQSKITNWEKKLDKLKEAQKEADTLPQLKENKDAWAKSLATANKEAAELLVNTTQKTKLSNIPKEMQDIVDIEAFEKKFMAQEELSILKKQKERLAKQTKPKNQKAHTQRTQEVDSKINKLNKYLDQSPSLKELKTSADIKFQEAYPNHEDFAIKKAIEIIEQNLPIKKELHSVKNRLAKLDSPEVIQSQINNLEASIRPIDENILNVGETTNSPKESFLNVFKNEQKLELYKTREKSIANAPQKEKDNLSQKLQETKEFLFKNPLEKFKLSASEWKEAFKTKLYLNEIQKDHSAISSKLGNKKLKLSPQQKSKLETQRKSLSIEIQDETKHLNEQLGVFDKEKLTTQLIDKQNSLQHLNQTEKNNMKQKGLKDVFVHQLKRLKRFGIESQKTLKGLNKDKLEKAAQTLESYKTQKNEATKATNELNTHISVLKNELSDLNDQVKSREIQINKLEHANDSLRKRKKDTNVPKKEALIKS